VFKARPLVGGRARGPVLVLDEPLSFWGGIDPDTGVLIDRRHPQYGALVTGAVLAMPSGRGSSSSSSVLAEAIRAATAPAAVILKEADGIIALGSLVARELYGLSMPVVVAEPSNYGELVPGTIVSIEGAEISVEPGSAAD
jgi:predicted aconitase with swiveling domain